MAKYSFLSFDGLGTLWRKIKKLISDSDESVKSELEGNISNIEDVLINMQARLNEIQNVNITVDTVENTSIAKLQSLSTLEIGT